MVLSDCHALLGCLACKLSYRPPRVDSSEDCLMEVQILRANRPKSRNPICAFFWEKNISWWKCKNMKQEGLEDVFLHQWGLCRQLKQHNVSSLDDNVLFVCWPSSSAGSQLTFLPIFWETTTLPTPNKLSDPNLITTHPGIEYVVRSPCCNSMTVTSCQFA